MEIKKRNGELQEFDPSKILNRIKKQCEGLTVDFTQIVIEVQQLLYNEITTEQIDIESARIAGSYSTVHPDYSILAARLYVSRLHKELLKTDYFDRCSFMLDDNIEKKANLWKVTPNYDVDYNFDYFGVSAVLTIYSIKDGNLKPIELPSEVWFRVCLNLAESKEEFELFYNELSAKLSSGASPILINSGLKKGGMISCSLNTLNDDSTEGIHFTLGEIAKMSRDSAGIGLWTGNLRSMNTLYANRGKAGGIVKFAKILQEWIRFFKQNENKKGAIAIYTDIWHMDLYEFLELRSKNGADESTAKDIFTALSVPDLFYKRVIAKEKWSLFCPHQVKQKFGFNLYDFVGDEFESKYKEVEASNISRITYPAMDVIMKCVKHMVERGTPYLFNRDNANKNYNLSNLGVLKGLNLCVAPETQILTDEGYVEIQELNGRAVNIWNGKEWSLSNVFKTSDSEKLYEISFSNKSVVNATAMHRWYLYDTTVNKYSKKQMIKRTCDLKEGDVIIDFDLPIIPFEEEITNSYSQGLFSADGSYDSSGYPIISLYGKKQNLIEYLEVRKKYFPGTKNISEESYIKNYDNKTIVGLNLNIKPKFFVPIKYSLNTRLRWLEGFVDGDGCLTDNNGTLSIQVCSINFEFLKEIKQLLNTLGCSVEISDALDEGERFLPDSNGNSKLYNCKKTYRLFINNYNLHKLKTIGFSPKRLVLDNVKENNRKCNRLIKVESVIDTNVYSETYCLHEPKNNTFIANGVLTGNCIEFMGYHDSDTSAQCDLGAIPVHKHVKNKKVDYESIAKSVQILTRLLNRVIDKNRWSSPTALKGGLEQRNIGIGIAGLADLAAILDLPFTSSEFKQINKNIAEVIYFNAIQASRDYYKYYLTVDVGFEEKIVNQTPLVKEGKLHFDLETTETFIPKQEWQSLLSEVKKGVSNSLLVCYMPTASTSILLGCNEAFEPFQDLLFSRVTILGEFTIFNKYLVQDLIRYNVWNDKIRLEIISNESIQNINFGLPLEIEKRLKEKYLTIWELKQKDLIDMAADRQLFTDQSQSMNLYWKEGDANKIINALIYGWSKGLKTGVYYTRVKPQTSSDKKLAFKTIKEVVKKNDNFECFGCSA